MELNLDLTPAQAAFVEDTTTKELLLCGGYGSGKSRAGVVKAILLALANPGLDGIVASPTIGLAKRTIVKQLVDVLDSLGIKYKFNRSDLIFKIDAGGVRDSEIHILSAENLQRIVGMNAAFFIVDELDTLDMDTARDAWRLLSARVRVGNVRQACATTTPEGFKFCHQHWHLEPLENPELAKDRRLIRARTFDSPFVDDEYIRGLIDSYPPQLIKTYLEGEFTNLESGTVYVNFDRTLNSTHLSLADLPEQRPLIVGVDFNYAGMSAVTLGQFGEAKRDMYGRATLHDEDVTVVVDEIIGSKNTRELIVAMKDRYHGRSVIVCPDASGNQGKSSATMTDIALLKDAGFDLRYNGQNPRVKDRINAVNARFLNGRGNRRLLINTKTAPLLTRCLEHQTYGPDGQPVKGIPISDRVNTAIDGPVDSLGYATWQFWPLVGRATARVS